MYKKLNPSTKSTGADHFKDKVLILTLLFIVRNLQNPSNPPNSQNFVLVSKILAKDLVLM